MCGIAGARHDWLLERGLDPATAMRDAIAALGWRGPDGQDTARAGSWWLGCARLAITQPRSTQPVVRRGGRFVGVLNGAITDARARWATRWPDRASRALPNDAWLPLLAIEAGETEQLAHLRGHHAYAVVDVGRDELVLGQDRFGEKPLCCLVARRGDAWQLVAFASTTAALWQLGMPKAFAARRVAETLRFGWCAARSQRFGSRLRLDPLPVRGAPVTVAPGSRGWCTPLPTQGAQPRSTAGDDGPLAARLVAAVDRCLDVEVGAGLALSGGIDSSCIALAMRRLGRRAPAFQFCAAGRPDDERRAARVVTARTGLELHQVDGGPELLDALPQLTRCAGAVLGDPSMLAAHAVARAAAAAGVRVLLGGEGGDELLLGYRRYKALARLPRTPWLRSVAPRWSMRTAGRYLRAMVAANPIRALLAVTPPAFGDAVLAPGLAARRCWRDAEPLPADAPPELTLAARADDLANYLPRDLLPKTDVALMAAGVEGRCPFLEADLQAFGARRDQLGKRELLAAFAGELPTEVLRLGKRGFAVPLDDWFRGDLPWLDVLREQRTCQRAHLRPGGVADVLDRHRRGAADLGHGLYLLLAIELHLRDLDATEESVTT